MTKLTIRRVTNKLMEAGFFWLGFASPVLAQGELQEGAQAANPGTTDKGLFDAGGIFQTIVNTIIFIVGAISVLMLIIGGLRYVLSSGDQNAVTGARNTIIYAIVGIVIAFLSFAAVDFVIDRLSSN